MCIRDSLGATPARHREVALANEGATRPGEWTAHEVVLHLVAVELEVFQRRLHDLGRPGEPAWSWVEPRPRRRHRARRSINPSSALRWLDWRRWPPSRLSTRQAGGDPVYTRPWAGSKEVEANDETWAGRQSGLIVVREHPNGSSEEKRERYEHGKRQGGREQGDVA